MLRVRARVRVSFLPGYERSGARGAAWKQVMGWGTGGRGQRLLLWRRLELPAQACGNAGNAKNRFSAMSVQ